MKCDSLKASFCKVMGVRESQLNEALESIKVVRQAYHGNVMVGNHCIIVLNHYQKLTSVTSSNQELSLKFNAVIWVFMILIMARRFLTEEEIDIYAICVKSSEKYFQNIFPKEA